MTSGLVVGLMSSPGSSWPRWAEPPGGPALGRVRFLFTRLELAASGYVCDECMLLLFHRHNINAYFFFFGWNACFYHERHCFFVPLILFRLLMIEPFCLILRLAGHIYTQLTEGFLVYLCQNHTGVQFQPLKLR